MLARELYMATTIEALGPSYIPLDPRYIVEYIAYIDLSTVECFRDSSFDNQSETYRCLDMLRPRILINNQRKLTQIIQQLEEIRSSKS